MKIVLDDKNFDPNTCQFVTTKGKLGGPISKKEIDKMVKVATSLRINNTEKEITSSEMEGLLSTASLNREKGKVRVLEKPTNGGYIAITSLLVTIGSIAVAVVTFMILSSVLGA